MSFFHWCAGAAATGGLTLGYLVLFYFEKDDSPLALQPVPTSSNSFTESALSSGIKHHYSHARDNLPLYTEKQWHDFSTTSEYELAEHDTDFTNILLRTGLNTHLQMGGGLAVGDVNKDELPDIFLVGGSTGENKLLVNNGNGEFSDISATSHIDMQGEFTNGASFADITGDGYDDLIVGGVIYRQYNNKDDTELKSTRPGKLWVWENQTDGTFKDISAQASLKVYRNVFSSAFSDFDKDGDLDLALAHWHRGTSNKQETHLWVNQQGRFTAFDTSRIPLSSSEKNWSFTPSFSDLNNDGWQDLLYVSDFESSEYFINREGRWFINATNPAVISDENGMGSAVGDYDNDGDLDWFVSSVYDPTKIKPSYTRNWGSSGNRLYQNIGNGEFKDVTTLAGVRNGGWGWGSCMADFNLDGMLDIFHVNGFLYDDDPALLFLGKQFTLDTPRLFINIGEGEFEDQAKNWGLQPGEGRAISCTDFDRDGDVDILIQQSDKPTKLYINSASVSSGNNFLGVRLKGEKGNPHAAGTRVILKTQGSAQIREIQIGGNYLSQNAAEALFGLAGETIIDEIEIHWHGLNSKPQVIKKPDVNQWLLIDINSQENHSSSF